MLRALKMVMSTALKGILVTSELEVGRCSRISILHATQTSLQALLQYFCDGFQV